MNIISGRAYLSELLLNWLGNTTLDSLFDGFRKNPQILCVPSPTLFFLGVIIASIFAIAAIIDKLKHRDDAAQFLKHENHQLRHKSALKDKRLAKSKKCLKEKDMIIAEQKTSLDYANKTITKLKLEKNEFERKANAFESGTRLGLYPHSIASNDFGIGQYVAPTLSSLGIPDPINLGILPGLAYNPVTKIYDIAGLSNINSDQELIVKAGSLYAGEN